MSDGFQIYECWAGPNDGESYNLPLGLCELTTRAGELYVVRGHRLMWVQP